MYRNTFINKYLKNGYAFEDAKNEVDFATDVLFNYGYKDFVLGKTLEQWQLEKLEKIFIERIKTHKPIQQLVGQAYFYGRKFFVNKNTLIPRPETELLVQTVLEFAKEIKNPKILDIGTGTGCIPLTLFLENNDISVDSVDISEKAIETAKKNALFHNVFDNVRFINSDLFENVNEKYNIIVSNPPYIPLKDKETLETEVKDFDPALALFTQDEHGVEFYKKIIEDADSYLLPDGYIAFELGINQDKIVENMLSNNNYKQIKIINDLNSIPRIIIAQKR